jgi:hypothetical protein
VYVNLWEIKECVLENPRGRKHLRYACVGGRIIVKYVVKQQIVRV